MPKVLIARSILSLLGVISVFLFVFWQIEPNSSITSSSDEASTLDTTAVTGERNTATNEVSKASTVSARNSADTDNLLDNIGRSLESDQVTSFNTENTITPDRAQQEGGSNEDLDLLVSDFSDLLYVDSPNFSIENKIAIEEDILHFVDQNPESVAHLFDLYEQSYDPEYMRAVIDVVSMIENPHVEQFALKQVDKDLNDNTLSWLQVLRSTGLSLPEDRAHVLSKLDQFSDPVMLSNALSTLKYRPYPVDEAERDEIVSHLQMYISHENVMVSEAAVAVINNWNHDVL